MLKTDDTTRVGKHAFELAGLGKAPFRFVGMEEKIFTVPGGYSKPGGSCDYCSTAIRFCCNVLSADGKRFKVGCDCIAKVGDEGLLKAYKRSPEFRKHQAELRFAKGQKDKAELAALIANQSVRLSALPHPRAFVDRETGIPMTMLDYATWMAKNCGMSGTGSVLRELRKVLA